MTGEYFVSLKNFKIPLKPTSNCDNPPPPGTEEDFTETINYKDAYVSPLAVINRPSEPTIEVSSAINPSITNQSNQLVAETPKPANKRSGLFSN